MTLALGTEPIPMSVTLVPGADFVNGFDSMDGDWPVGTVISLQFHDQPRTTWVADVSGEAVDWNIDKAEVDALIGRLPGAAERRVRLLYKDGSADLVWAQGDVVIKGRW